MGLDKNAIGNMKWQSYEPKPFEDVDIDIKITHAGICGSGVFLELLYTRTESLTNARDRPSHTPQRMGRDSVPLCGKHTF